MTEEYLAERCERSDKEIRNIESGKTIPKLDTALQIGHVLHMEMGEFHEFVKVEDVAYV